MQRSPRNWKQQVDVESARLLEAELLLLRKGLGFTPARLAKTVILRDVLGGNDETYEAQEERFVSAIQSLRSPERELLLAVFGLTSATRELTSLAARRDHYGTEIGRKAATVADLEPQALERLRSQLITGWYPKSPLAIRVPESHNGIVQEAVSIAATYRDGHWQETREHYRFLGFRRSRVPHGEQLISWTPRTGG